MLSNIKKRWFAILITLLPFNSFSQMIGMKDSSPNWKFYGVDVDTVKKSMTMYYIDSNYRARDQYGYLKVWERVEYSEETKDSKKDNNTATETLYAIDCATKRFVILQIILKPLFENKIIKRTQFQPEPQDWQDIVPGTVGETLVESACELFNK